MHIPVNVFEPESQTKEWCCPSLPQCRGGIHFDLRATWGLGRVRNNIGTLIPGLSSITIEIFLIISIRIHVNRQKAQLPEWLKRFWLGSRPPWEHHPPRHSAVSQLPALWMRHNFPNSSPWGELCWTGLAAGPTMSSAYGPARQTLSR